MTEPVKTLQQLASEAVLYHNLTDQLSPHLVEYVQHIVDLSTVANEPYLIQQASLEFNQTIRDIATQEQWDAQYQELMQHAQGLIDRADQMQDLIASAVFFIDGAASDDEWIAYYKEVCQQASWTLDEVKQRCQVFLNDFQDYQPLDHAEVD